MHASQKTDTYKQRDQTLSGLKCKALELEWSRNLREESTWDHKYSNREILKDMYSATENCSIMHLNKNMKAISYCSNHFEHARSGRRSHEGKSLHEIKERRKALSSCSNMDQPQTHRKA